jgi:hypothetical protein
VAYDFRVCGRFFLGGDKEVAGAHVVSDKGDRIRAPSLRLLQAPVNVAVAAPIQFAFDKEVAVEAKKKAFFELVT